MKNKLFYIIVIFVILIIGVLFGVVAQRNFGSESNIPKEFHGKLQLFILVGQSNMVGMGIVPMKGEKDNDRIFVFGNDYQWKKATEPIDDPSGQVDKVSKDKKAGFSSALSFAKTLLEQNPELVIGLIPCAKGSSSIYEWQRNLSVDSLYGSCLKRVNEASAMGDVAGILFFQGEKDAEDPNNNPHLILQPNQWGREFIKFVNDMRMDLDLPNLPIIFAQIGTNTTPEDFVNWEIVKMQQLAVQVPFSAMITTDDLILRDKVHFTTLSYIEIGTRFAEAYLSLLKEHQK